MPDSRLMNLTRVEGISNIKLGQLKPVEHSKKGNDDSGRNDVRTHKCWTVCT